MSEMDDLVSVPLAAERAGVSRNTMHRAAKKGTIRAKKLGRDWFIYASDIERWKQTTYRPDKAIRFPVKGKEDDKKE